MMRLQRAAALTAAVFVLGCSSTMEESGALRTVSVETETELPRSESPQTESFGVRRSAFEGDDEVVESRPWIESVDEFAFGSSSKELERRAIAEEAAEKVTPPTSSRPVPAPNSEQKPPPGHAAATEAAFGFHARTAGRLVDAVAHFTRAVDLSPAEDGRWLYLRVLADSRLALWENEAALQDYQHLKTILPASFRSDYTLHGNVAVAYYRLGRLPEAHREAELSLKIAAGLNHDFAEGLKTLGLVDLKEGNTAVGVARLTKAVGKKPAIPEAQLALAEYDEANGRFEAAETRYRYLLDVMRSPEFRDPHRRWRYLFGPREKTTQVELTERIERLKSRQESRG